MTVKNGESILFLMTKLPKRPLPIPTKEKIIKNFTVFLKSLDGKDFDIFCLFFLSRTERLVLAKRLQIAILLLKGNDYQVISDSLDTSSKTVSRINNILMAQPEITKVVDKVFLAPKRRADREKKEDKKLREGAELFKTPTLGKNIFNALFGDKESK